MPVKLAGTISVDVDTLASIFKGKKKYHCYEFSEGLENMSCFLSKYKLKATLFCVGKDLTNHRNRIIITQLSSAGFEIANHTYSHAQGLRLLSYKQKLREIIKGDNIIRSVIKKRPQGFRSPGWNIDETVLKILIKNGYKYDASVFPTFMMPVMKMLHFFSMSKRSAIERTTMGRFPYMFLPIMPYTTSNKSFSQGLSDFWEFPVAVTPYLRFPFFATSTLKLGYNLSSWLYRQIRYKHLPLQFMLHLFDFVDFSQPRYQKQLINLKGSYTPQSLFMPLKSKMEMWERLFDLFCQDYQFFTYEQRVNQ